MYIEKMEQLFQATPYINTIAVDEFTGIFSLS
jgi:hypothetical protein